MNKRSSIAAALIPGVFALVAILLVGCTTTSYTDPSGAKFSRTSFLNKQSIGKVSMKAGDKTLLIEGYSNEQTETAAAVANAVASALAPVAK